MIRHITNGKYSRSSINLDGPVDHVHYAIGGLENARDSHESHQGARRKRLLTSFIPISRISSFSRTRVHSGASLSPSACSKVTDFPSRSVSCRDGDRREIGECYTRLSDGPEVLRTIGVPTGMMCAETQRSTFLLDWVSNSCSDIIVPSLTGAGPWCLHGKRREHRWSYHEGNYQAEHSRFPGKGHHCLVRRHQQGASGVLVAKPFAQLNLPGVRIEDGRRRLDREEVRECRLRVHERCVRFLCTR